MVQKHIARLVDELRLLFGFGTRRLVLTEFVGMVGNDELAMRLLDIVFGGAFLQAQGFECF